MKLNHIVIVALLTTLSSTVAGAQATKSAIVDSANKQLQRGAKSTKGSNGNAALKAATPSSKSTNTPTTSAKSASGTAAKPKRVVAIPAITPQSAHVAPAKTRVADATDSTPSATPPVRRSPKVAKTKPPAK